MDGNKTSNTLILLVKDQKDEAAWSKFTHTYRPYIFQCIRNKGVQGPDAEDLTQDVLLKVWKALETFIYEPSRCKFRTWLAFVTNNTAINYLKLKSTQQRANSIDIDSSDWIKLSRSAEVDQQAEAEWQVFIATKAWNTVKDKVQPSQLKVYQLSRQEFSVEEISEQTGIKTNSVYKYKKAVEVALANEIRRLSHELDG